MKKTYAELMQAISKQMIDKEKENNKAIYNYKVQVNYYAATYRYQPIYACEIDGTKYYGTQALPYCYDKLATVKRLLSLYRYGEWR